MSNALDEYVRNMIIDARAIAMESGDMDAVKEMNELLEGLALN